MISRSLQFSLLGKIEQLSALRFVLTLIHVTFLNNQTGSSFNCKQVLILVDIMQQNGVTRFEIYITENIA
jgi:hypothetical protein